MLRASCLFASLAPAASLPVHSENSRERHILTPAAGLLWSQQIGSAHNFRDLHRRIIDHDSKVGMPEHRGAKREVAKVLPT
jgi:hypothetical protein